MILVFKTDVTSPYLAQELIQKLNSLLPVSCNFDLDDCDNILRIEGCHISPCDVIALLSENGFACEELE